jgi:ubiquitin carboxyl-terminal hydrolase 25
VSSVSACRKRKEAHLGSYYASLGAVGDFSDALLLFAYERQVLFDPVNSPYYFECLQEIARGRDSESLAMHVMTLASQGRFSRKDIWGAYQYFGIDPRHESYISDESIIGKFQARLPDVSEDQEVIMRQQLRTLGQARQSARLEQAASYCGFTPVCASSWPFFTKLTAAKPSRHTRRR